MRSFTITIFFSICTIVLIFLNLLALMRLIPLFITLPLLFISLYITLYSLMNRRTYGRYRHRS